MSYRVELPVFSGPMDLLLHLVRQHEVDIHEVAIAPILDAYLRHLSVLQQLDLHDIGDFVVMASTLMEIKSRELLPNEAVELEQELDPKDDLIRRLLEYKRYRDLARELETRHERRARQANLTLPQPPAMQHVQDEDLLDLGELGVWDLTSAFARLLEEIGQQGAMEIEVEKRDVGFYTQRLLEIFRRRREVLFSEVFELREGRYALIGTLVALLEMMKQGYLRAHQEACFDEIRLAFLGDADVTADRILAGIAADEQREAERQELATAAAAPPPPGAAGPASPDADDLADADFDGFDEDEDEDEDEEDPDG